MDRRRQPHQRDSGIFTDRHTGGAGVVLHPFERDSVLAAADNRSDNADAQALVFQFCTLFDMRFQIAAVAGGVDGQARQSGKPGGGERVAQLRGVVFVAAGVDFCLGQMATKRFAAKKTAVMAFLVGLGSNLYAHSCTGGVGGERPGHFKAVNHPQGAI